MSRTPRVRQRLLALVVAAATCTGTAAAIAPAASAAPSATATNDELVQAWYADFLLREDPAADPERAYWVGRLDRGNRAGDVLWSLTETREYAETSVEETYAAFLGRDLDPGAEYWVSGVDERGMALEWVQQNVLASDEFYRDQASGSPAVAVSLWYQVVLGRTPSSGELTYWKGRVAKVGRLGALREIWYTPEGVTTRVVINYAYLLGREPSAGEIRYWSPKEVESDRNVGVLIAATPEYSDLVAGEDDDS